MGSGARGARCDHARIAVALTVTLAVTVAAVAPALATFVFQVTWGSLGSGNGQFQSPADVATDAAGHVYVADAGNHRIQKFDSSGTFLLTWGSTGSGAGQFQSPTSVATDAAGDVYVVDNGNSRVQKFTATGTFLLAWGTSGSGPGEFNNPSDVAAGPGGVVYVVEQSNHRVQKFDASGNFLATWGTFGTANGQFRNPMGIGVDQSTGHVYVVDSQNTRIQKFSPDGTFVLAWGSRGSGDGQFGLVPDNGIAVDASGNVYVGDTANDRVQKFSPTGAFIDKAGTSGSATNQFKAPRGVAVGVDTVYVADTGNHRIQKLGTDSTPPVGTVTIDGGAVSTASTAVVLGLQATDGHGVTAYRVANGADCSGATYVAVTSTTSYSAAVAHALASGDGTKTVCAQFRDADGNESAVATDTIELDTTAPVGTITIDGGAAFTNTTAATLDLTATDAVGVTSYRVADGADCSGATYVPVTSATSFDADVAHTLPVGDGTKTVCAQFRDAAGNESATVVDTIGLDTVTPTVAVSVPGTPQFLAGEQRYVRSTTLLRVTVTEEGGGLAGCTVAFDGPAAADTTAACAVGDTDTTLATVPVPRPAGAYQVTATATDAAGSTASAGVAVVLDDAAPVFGECPKGPVFLGTGTRTLTITATDTGAGVDLAASVLEGTIDTSTIATRSVTFAAADNLGNARTKTCSYLVHFGAQCTATTGSFTTYPGLLLKTAAPQTLTLNAPLTCTGHVTKGNVSASFRTPTEVTCGSIVGKWSASFAGKFTWTRPAGLAGTAAAKLNLKITATSGHTTRGVLQGSVTSGPFKGKPISGSVTLGRGLVAVASGGDCTVLIPVKNFGVTALSLRIG
jgi:sugar lactone lactonase YvrE